MPDKSDVILEVKNLKKYFETSKTLLGKSNPPVKAVDDISFYIKRGETLGIVGESGCGKSTTGRTLIKLYEATDGQVIFNGKDVSNIKGNELFSFRKNVQMIFQDPYASLNSRMTVGDIIAEPMIIHKMGTKKEIKEKVYELLDNVGMNHDHAARYPHEFSGGQRQRIGIARALAVKPSFIICDEPISALDVSIQAQVINMLVDLQQKYNLTYLFIAHDLSMVRYISNRIGVMYLGKMVEIADANTIYKNPKHPYSQALLSAIPIPDPDEAKKSQRILLEGDVPSPINPPSGCRFRTRCRYVMDICSKVEPEFKEIEKEHFCACHLY